MSPALAQWARDQGHDAEHASALGLDRATDTAIIDRAAADARIVVTADLDYPRLLALAGTVAPSLILFRGGDWSETEIVDHTRRLLATLHEDQFEQCIIVVERDRIRRCRLPID